MSTVAEIEDAVEKLQMEDFAKLMEDLRDLELARAALEDIERDGETVSQDVLESRLGLFRPRRAEIVPPGNPRGNAPSRKQRLFSNKIC